MNDKVVLGLSSPSIRKPLMPVSFPPSLALDQQPTVKPPSSKIKNLGTIPVGPLDACHPNQPPLHAPSLSAEVASSADDSEVEESSSGDSDDDLCDSSELGPKEVPISSPPAANGATSPVSSPRAADAATKVVGSTPGSGMPPSVSAVESVGRVEFSSSCSDPMFAEVAAAMGGWETVKKKKHNSRNGKQAVAMGDGSEMVGLADPLASGGFS
ncbi:hypothetical protein OIU84_002882, partial [Salix udensis]